MRANKTVLITGAAQRIGAAAARYLHSKQFNVVVHYNRSALEANRLVDELNHIRADSSCTVQADLLAASSYDSSRLILVQADLLAASSYDWVIDAALELSGSLDALVNNASMFYPTLLPQIKEPTWDEIIGTNLKAPLFLARHAAVHLEKTQGCIINITDIHGSRPLPQYSMYSVAKSGLIMLTRSLAQELAPNVRVNAVSPGAILWPDGMGEEAKDSILSAIPLQRRGLPVDVARAVHFLIAEADYITGQVLAVDGGRSLSP